MSKRLSLVIVPLLVCLAWPGAARAQYKLKPLDIGELSFLYSQIGGETEGYGGEYQLKWPNIWQTGVERANAVWLGVKNVPAGDGSGKVYDYRVVHVGPRPTGAGEYFPLEFKTVSRFEPPLIEVVDQYGDKVRTFQEDPDNDAVDPNLPADRMVMTKVSSLVGIQITRRNYAYSNDRFDNFHIQEYVLTNTGDTDGDLSTKEIDQTLEGVYLNLQRRYDFGSKFESPATGGGWGQNVMNDVIGNGVGPDYGRDFKAVYTWLGNFSNDYENDVDDYGLPMWSQHLDWAQPTDSFGRLSETQFMGVVTIYTDPSTDNAAQPAVTGWFDSDYNLLKNNSPFNEEQMRQEYMDVIQTPNGGAPDPETEHAYWVERNGDGYANKVYNPEGLLTPEGDVVAGAQGGYQLKWSYGPYNIAPGDSVVIVTAEAVDGLTMNEASAIGRKFKLLANSNKAAASSASGLATTPNITYRGVTLSKNGWYFTGRDSLFDTFERAITTYESSDDMTQYPTNINEPPRPPSHFVVASGAGKITLDWEFAGGYPANGVEVYRTESYIEGKLKFDNDSDPMNDPFFTYDCIAGCEGTPDPVVNGATGHYEDANVTRGVDYYYYIQTVGPDGLKSNRYWTQTYDPARKLRDPGENLSDFRVVPNPFNIAADEGVRYPGAKREKIGFLDIPGNATIRIYTEKGELVKTIEHTTGTGDEYWDITTDSQQYLVSGLYIVTVTNNETGESVIKKFVVIR